MIHNEEFSFISSLEYSQNKNTITQINLIDQTFYIKYKDQSLVKKIKSNSRILNKLTNFIPKLIEEYSMDDSDVFLDFIPGGSLADLIHFNEMKIDSPYIKEFDNIKAMTIYFLISISEIFIKNNLFHSNFTPEHILFSSNNKIIIGGIEHIQPLANKSNSYYYDDTPFLKYIAPEVIEGKPVQESFSYSLSLLIYSIITLSFIDEIPKQCPKSIDKNLFTFLISCCNPDPNKRPKITDIKREISKVYKKPTNLNFDQVYANIELYGTKENLVKLIEMQYPTAFYIVGSTFSNGNIFDMTSKEAVSFLNVSKEKFCKNIHLNSNGINKYYMEQEQIYVADIDEQLDKISKIPKEVSNISFYNEDPSMIEDQINISIFNTSPSKNNEFFKYGYYGIQAINDCLEADKQITCPLDELFISQPSALSVDNQNLNMFQSIANAKLICREKCDTAISHRQKRNVNFHSFTQIGALQVATRMFSELSSDINYDIVLNTGRGLHSTKPDSTNLNGNKTPPPKNPNLEGNDSILCSTLSTAVEKFTGKQPSIGENQGFLTTEVINIEKENNGDYYF